MRKYFAFRIVFVLTLCVLCVFLLTMCNNNKFRDDFDTLDTTRWVINEFSFPDAGNEMTREAIELQNSILSITLSENVNASNKKAFKGGEIGTKRFYSYGTFSVKMKNDIKTGTVSSFFLMNQWKPKNWVHKEIDIEFLGKDPRIVQFTVHLFPNDTSHIYYHHVHNLGFDSSEDFHEYAIQWRENSIVWVVDGREEYTENRIVPDTLMQIRLNHWMANDTVKAMTAWLGVVSRDSLPSKVYYDWVKYDEIKE